MIFIRQGSSWVDGQLETPLNNNDVKNLITFRATNGRAYDLADLTNVEVVDYNSLFSFYTDSPIRYEDIAEVEAQILGTWRVAGNKTRNIQCKMGFIVRKPDFFACNQKKEAYKPATPCSLISTFVISSIFARFCISFVHFFHTS